MDFKARQLKYRVKDKARFNAAEVKEALKAQGFADVEVRSAPS